MSCQSAARGRPLSHLLQMDVHVLELVAFVHLVHRYTTRTFITLALRMHAMHQWLTRVEYKTDDTTLLTSPTW